MSIPHLTTAYRDVATPNIYGNLLWAHSSFYGIADGATEAVKDSPDLRYLDITHITLEVISGALGGFFRIRSDWTGKINMSFSEEGSVGQYIYLGSNIGTTAGDKGASGLPMSLALGGLNSSNWRFYSADYWDGPGSWKVMNNFGLRINYYGPSNREKMIRVY